MKKKLRLKKSVKTTLLVILVLVSSAMLVIAQEKANYKRAIERCGSKENITTRYTNQGDKYYTCKVAK